MDDKASVLLGELSRLKRRFEAIEALAPNCILTTERSTILSRYQARRSVPVHAPMPEMDLPAGYSRMIVPGNGCEISPKTISSFDELATAVVLYFPTGEPCVTVNREPRFKTAGWETNHQLTISGRDCHAVAKVIQAANHWCLGNRNWIQSIGLIPPVVKLDVLTLLWPDVVLALAERSTYKPRWMISVTAYTKISLSSWRNKSHREQLKEFTGSPGGISDEVVALIGDEPEDLHTTLDDFISQSVTAIDSLLKLAEMNANKIAPVVVPADPMAENGLDRSKREFIWFGVRYEWLTETMMNALQVLFKAYQQQQRKVLPEEMVNMIGNLPLGGFFKVFEVDRAGWGKVHPVREIVGGHARSGWYLIAQNSSQT